MSAPRAHNAADQCQGTSSSELGARRVDRWQDARVDLGDLHLVTSRLAPSTSAEIHEAQRLLDAPLLVGYSDFVLRYGAGLVGDMVRVYGPDGVVSMTREWRDRVTEYWVWETAGTGVTPEMLQSNGVVVADTIGGDEVCFVAGTPDRCIILPRDGDDAVAITGGLEQALSWLLESGEIIKPAPLPTFEPWVGRAHPQYAVAGEAAFAGVRDGLVALGLHSLVQDLGTGLTLVVPTAGALVQVRGQRWVTVSVSHDADAPEAVLALVTGVLEDNGLRRS